MGAGRVGGGTAQWILPQGLWKGQDLGLRDGEGSALPHTARWMWTQLFLQDPSEEVNGAACHTCLLSMQDLHPRGRNVLYDCLTIVYDFTTATDSWKKECQLSEQEKEGESGKY